MADRERDEISASIARRDSAGPLLEQSSRTLLPIPIAGAMS